jgi:drug/metabolite transporter (DMT)-like permease
MENSKNNLAPHVALLAVQFFFGSATVLGKYALEAFPSTAIVGFRVVCAALAFFLLQRWRGSKSLRLDRKIHYLYFAIFAFFGVILNQLFFFKGLQLTTATNTSLLAVMIPVFAFVISALIGNDRLSWRKILGIILAACGVVYLIDPAKASFSSATTQGDILVILNSLSYAIYVALSKKLITYYGALKSIAWLFLFASIVILPLGLFSLQTVNLSEVGWSAWLTVAAIVVFPTILAYYWNTWALARVEPSVVAVYIYLQPLIGTFLATLLLGEQWKPRIFLAMTLIFAGVYLVIRNRKLDAAESHITGN